jgi:ubiquinone/menaquinone biosynthesis C-methylase UbiE
MAMNIIERLDLLFVNRPKRGEARKREALSLFDAFSLPDQPQGLEIGCGQGIGTRILVEKYKARMIASDIDAGQIELARERLADLRDGEIEFRECDARNMPFDDGSFDVVCAFGVLHHIDPGWSEVVSEVGRVLKPGGCFVFIDWLMSETVSRFVRRTITDWDIVDEPMLKEALEKSSLATRAFESERCWLGLMLKCRGVACKG